MIKEIVPAILTQSEIEVSQRISQLAGLTHRIHIDIMDGIFVPDETIKIESLLNLDSILEIELHLMVVHPERYLDMAQKSMVRHVIVHVEAMQEPRSVLHEISARGMKRCLAVSPETQLEKLFAVADTAEQITVMGVNPGASGQPMLPQTIDRIREVKKYYSHIPIEVDGGVNVTNLHRLSEAGADLFAMNSALFSSGDLEKKLHELRSKIS